MEENMKNVGMIIMCLMILFFSAALAGAADPKPVLKANHAESSFSIQEGQPLTITAQFSPGSFGGQGADWWVIYNSPSTGLYYYDLMNSWQNVGDDVTRLMPTYQGGLVSIPETPVFVSASLPPGKYQFYFGVDMTVNGIIDIDTLYYDSVEVTVTPGSNPVTACADIAGEWRGPYSETYCDGQTYKGIWTATITAACHITAFGEAGEWYQGFIKNHKLRVVQNDYSCGTSTINATVNPGGISGSYTYSKGGQGTFSGTRQ